MSLAFGLALPHWYAIFGGAFSPASLFAGGTVAGAWYDPSDLSTMFTTSAGTTPVAMPGLGSAVSVGLMLDKSQGVQRFWSGAFNGSNTQLSVASNAAFTLGSSGDFTIECWLWLNGSQSGVAPVATTFADWNDFSNRWTLGVNGLTLRWYDSNGGVGISTTLTAYSWSHIAVARNGSTITLYVNGASVGTQTTNQAYTTQGGVTVGRMLGQAWYLNGYISNLRIVKGTAVYTGNFTPPSPVTGLTAISGTSLLTCQNSTFIDNSSNAFAITVTNAVTSQNIPLGNHAIAFNDTTARPELRARVNLLTYSEDWTNAVWTGGSDRTNVTTTPNAGTNPIGGSNATRLQGTANNWFQGQTVSLTSLTPLVLSLWVKSNTGSSQTFRLFGTGTAQISSDLTATTDWQQFLFPYTPTNTAQQCGIIRNSSNSTADLLIWGADLRPANIGANVPAYQRIADANTYDTAGFPLYLRFDGIDDSMYTPANLNLSGTDKVSVFAGVRKQAAGLGFVAELSSNTSANNGSFYVVADNGTNDYGMSARGTSQGAYQPQTYTAPISNVLTASYDIAGATLATEIVPRVNGAVVQTVPSGSCGTGNFGTYPLYIGARNNASGWLNGQLYSLIIAGSAVSAGNISATEQWVAQRTGIVIP